MIFKTSFKYNLASKLYDFMERGIEKKLFFRLREMVIPLATGAVLEIGVGTGKNLRYYNPSAKVSAIDFSKGMLDKAEKKLKNLNRRNMELILMDAQSLSFENNSFDSITAAFVFCTVPDPVKGLKESYRVLKPGGKAFFIEHMLTDNYFINSILFMMNIFSKIFLGTSMIRKTEDNIKEAGFKVISSEKYYYGIVRVIVAEKS